MNKINLNFNIKKRTFIVLFFLIMGFIIGPFYSVASFYNLSKSQSTSGTNNIIPDSKFDFLPFTTNISAKTYNYQIVIHSSSLYALVVPTQDFNGSNYYFASIGTYELLEVNFTDNFHSIDSINTYNLTLLPVHSTYSYDGLFFDGKQFWTYNDQNSTSLLSFTKQGLILTNHPLPVPVLNGHIYSHLVTTPLGIYNNEFWRLESGYEQLSYDSSEFFGNISAYSLNSFSRVFSEPFNTGTLPLGGDPLGFIDNGMLWYRETNYLGEDSFYGFSMQEIINSAPLQLNTTRTLLVRNGTHGTSRFIQSIKNFELSSYGLSDGNMVSIASTIHNNMVIQIYATHSLSSFDQSPIMLLGVVLNNPVSYKIGTSQMTIFYFGYAITGIMSVTFLKMEKREKKKENNFRVSSK